MNDLLAPHASTIVALVIALSFAAGLNVYATMLVVGVLGRLHWAVLPPGLAHLADTWIMTASGMLFLGEVFADKIPGLDLLWNLIHTFIRIPIAAVLAYAAGDHLSPGAHVLVTCLGIVVASIAHGSKTAARVAVTPSPEPVSNFSLSGLEDGLAAALSWAALHHPLATGVAAAALTAMAAGVIWWAQRRVRQGWSRWREGGLRRDVTAGWNAWARGLRG